MKKIIILSICNVFTLLFSLSINAQKIKVFILAGQSNMQGQGDILPANLPGTLTHFMNNGGNSEFEYLQNSNGDWATREDVWVRFDDENRGLLNDELAVGFGSNENQIGPELGFGHLLGNYIEDDQVLIIKTCWGGKNLAVDFRPPSSGGTVGPFYTQMLEDINLAIDNIATEFPDYAGQEIEIAGLGWFQGWNDGEEQAFLLEYEENLKNLISDLRIDLNVPDLPVVIGLTGNGGFQIDVTDLWVQGLQTILVPAQINAAEYTGHTKVNYAETRNFWRSDIESPEPDFIFHWRNNAESFLRIGNEMGLKMIEILNESLVANISPASGYGFNYFTKENVPNNNISAGYSFYSAVFPLMQEYPGAVNFQSGQGTWLTPQLTGNEPTDFYNTIEGGLGWWGDTRFATETPKFIMGGVAHSFDAAANGPGAGSSDSRNDGHRDWDTPGGKYGIAQLSPNLLWPPDGLNMEQESNGEFLGYGYYPLPLTDPMQQTGGMNFATGNQSWTLYFNTTNFKGPATFFIPTFWAATVLDDPSLEGLFLDSRPADPNMAFAQEYSASPALVATDDMGDVYGRILPPVYPKTTNNSSTIMRDVSVYSKDAKWNEVENWFNGGAIPTTELQNSGTFEIDFDISPFPVDAAIYSMEDATIDTYINQESYAQVKMSTDKKSALYEWDTSFIDEVSTGFIMPEFYKLSSNNEWEPIPINEVSESSGLLDNEPEITPRNDELAYITPLETDCHLFGTPNPWNSPGPEAGPFTVAIGDGSVLTYYWYRFIDQPSIIHADLPTEMRQNLQDRVELIHSNWSHTDNYIAPPTGGTLATIDQGLIVIPPTGLEIGYVPIVTRQEKNINLSTPTFENKSQIKIFPNPTQGLVNILSKNKVISELQLFDSRGRLINSKNMLNNRIQTLEMHQQKIGLYFLKVLYQDGDISNHKIIKSKN